MSRKKLLTRIGIAVVIAPFIFFLIFALTDLIIVYYVTKALERGLLGITCHEGFRTISDAYSSI